MATRQYIGARYVTKIYENSLDPSSAEWEASVNYEPLTMVTYNNGSYLSKKTVPASVGDPASNPDYWVQTGFYNGQITYLQEQINDMKDGTIPGSLQNQIDTIDNELPVIEDNIIMLKRNARSLHGNVILNHLYDATEGAVNGSAYVGNGVIVCYISVPNSNTGILRAFNRDTYTVAWEHSIAGYHGNSLTYNPTTNKLYICGCIDNVNSGYINQIVEIDMTNPSVVVRTFSLPNITEALTLAYDAKTDKYYATVPGATPGVSDLIYIYDSSFNYVNSITMVDFPAIKYSLSTQGLQCCIDGVGYVLVYDMAYIIGYDLADGSVVTRAALPEIVNDCRIVGEPQSLVYDYDNDDVIMGSVYTQTGAYNYYCNNFIELDLLKGIVELHPVPTNYVFGAGNNGVPMQLTIVPAGNTLKPSWLVNAATITVPNDAFIFAKYNNLPIRMYVAHSNAGISAQTYELYGLMLGNYAGRIQGVSAGDMVTIHHCRLEQHTEVQFLYCEFDEFDIGSNTYVNVLANANSKVYFQTCLFDDVHSGSTNLHLVAQQFAQLCCVGCTFNGSATNLNNLGGTITIE